MSPYTEILFLIFLLLLSGAEKVVAEDCSGDDLYAIKSTGSNNLLVLDGSDSKQVRVQSYTGFSSQLWQFRRGSKAGLYYIINNHTGEALDFAEDDLTSLVTRKKKNILNQQWNLTLNGRITNASIRKNVDVHTAKYTNGSPLHLHDDNGSHAQWFDIQPVDKKSEAGLGETLL